MKEIVYKCLKCDWEFRQKVPSGFMSDSDSFQVHGLCPRHTGLTYGPLTEDLVAEAIIAVADKWIVGHPAPWSPPAAMKKSLAVDEARFVLRLLDQIHNIEKPYGHRPDDIHMWLLDLTSWP